MINYRHHSRQVAVAFNDQILILAAGKLFSYANVDFRISAIRAFEPEYYKMNMMLVAGHFCSVKVIYAGKIVHSFQTTDWVYGILVLRQILRRRAAGLQWRSWMGK